ncbi:DUF4129 domain-containing protein [Mycobacterium riyadhense]|uniref:Protein-glutamine gamma-glutamyltransferase-like C-terminal domain-containing protein n=1 Tax=Mycobacterium riyadhense TaxID=486698 RepID=A0A1X2D6K1_9MYCO|nr:DUF4129 domain-containing protein [Mycobacterium riyadhense]MCV7148129.1 DUF4129 domain-containing protein [Mycobacterium riyadhense]ORW83730.1 hypothetical protein AWC22_14765 [Mycobacterium riyadhense]VTO95667.1 hypothetical protein BIN_B_01149 [Mycobacterium riyadhense]
MSDKPTGRIIVLIALLIVVAAALRGYLPARHGSRLAEAGGNRAALMFIVTAIAATLAILAFAIVTRLRDPRTVAPSVGDLSDMLGTGKGRPSWRALLIGFGVILAWLLIVLLLSRLFAPPEVVLEAPTQDSSAPPSVNGGAPPEQPQSRHTNTRDTLDILIASTVPLLLMLVAGAAIATRRRRRTPTPGLVAEDDVVIPPPPRSSESLVRAAEVGLAEIADLSREPRQAIIACYAAMERELANVPGAAPQDFDTPTEVLARAVEHHALHADNAVVLVDLFAEARFSPHVMNEGHREVAVRILRLVLDELDARSSI